MDVDDNNSKKTIMNIINPPSGVVVYQSPTEIEEIFSQMIYDDDPRRYHPVLLYNRDFGIFYILSNSSLFLLILFFGYYLIK